MRYLLVVCACVAFSLSVVAGVKAHRLSASKAAASQSTPIASR